MKSIERYGLPNWFGRKSFFRKQTPERRSPTDLGAMTAVERQCYVSLAKALGKQLESYTGPIYLGTANEFSPKIAGLRANLIGDPSWFKSSDFLFNSFYSLCDSLARDEPELQVDCENERILITKLYNASKNTVPYFLMPQFYATRVLLKMNYGNSDITQPSLDIGTGDGMTARFVFNDKRISIGSDLFIHDLLEAKRNPAPFDRLMAFDVTNIPFSDDTFGAVFSMYTVYHAEDKIAAIREIARVLAPGGTLCFDDIQSAAVTERPVVRALKDSGVFPKSADQFLRSTVKPQRYLGPEEYREILQECGCDEVQVVPFMSLPLWRVALFFHDLEIFFGKNSPTPSARRVKSLMAFLNSVIAPLIARDHELSAREGGAFWLVRATKRGKLNVDMPPANVMQRAICPVCRSAMAFTVDSVRCTSCATQFPIVNDVPIIATAYLNFFKELMDEKH